MSLLQLGALALQGLDVLLPDLLRSSGLVRGEAEGRDLLVELPYAVVPHLEPGHQFLGVRDLPASDLGGAWGLFSLRPMPAVRLVLLLPLHGSLPLLLRLALRFSLRRLLRLR